MKELTKLIKQWGQESPTLSRQLLRLFLFIAVLTMGGTNRVWAVTSITSGNYYIQNVSTGLYLCGENRWGTQGSVAVQGVEFTFTGSSNSYTILNTLVTATNKYLGENLFTDAVSTQWTVEAVSGKPHVYTISNSAGYLVPSATNGYLTGKELAQSAEKTAAAEWYILTMAEAVAGLSAATVSEPIDATFLLKNPGFNRNLSTTAWAEGNGCTNRNLSGPDLGKDEKNNTNRCAESFHSTFSFTQSLSGLPSGLYKVTAQGFYRQDGSDNENLPYIFANSGTSTLSTLSDNEINSMLLAGNAFKTPSNYQVGPAEGMVTDGNLNVGIQLNTNTNLWTIWDNFQMTSYGEANTIKVLDWSLYSWASHPSISAGAKEETVNGIKFTRSATTSGNEYKISDGILTFTADGNAQNTNRWIAIPLENIDGSITVNIAAVAGKQLQVKYQFVGGSTTITAPSSLSLSEKPTTGAPLSFTIPTGVYTNGVLYIGRNGSAQDQIGKVTITTGAPVPATHTVTYALNGGTGSAPSQPAVAEGEQFTVADAAGITKAGYTFMGWSDGENTYAAGSTYTMSTADVTLTAVWKSTAAEMSNVRWGAINAEQNGNTWTLTIPYGTEGDGISEGKPYYDIAFDVSAGATASPSSTLRKSLPVAGGSTNAQNVVVTAEDGATQKTWRINLVRGAAPIPTVGDLSVISSDYTLTPSVAFTANTLYEGDKIISLGEGSGYDNGLQIKKNRQIAFKVNTGAVVTVSYRANGAREMQMGSTSAAADLATSTNGILTYTATADGQLIYLSTNNDQLYMTRLSVVYPRAFTVSFDGDGVAVGEITQSDAGAAITLPAVHPSAVSTGTWIKTGGTNAGRTSTSYTGGEENFYEYYAGDKTSGAVGNMLTQTITGLTNGLYRVSFKAAVSSTNTRDKGNLPTGDNLSYAFAGTQEQMLTVVDRTEVLDAPTYTFTTLVTDGTLTFGIKNKQSSGNWYMARFESVTPIDFEGWYTETHGRGTRVGGPGDSYTPESDQTLYALLNSDATIKAINPYRGAKVTPAVDPDIRVYTVNQSADGNWMGTNKVTTSNPNATVSVGSNKTFKNSTFTVRSQDGTVTNYYQIIYEAPVGWREEFTTANYPLGNASGDQTPNNEEYTIINGQRYHTFGLNGKVVNHRFVLGPNTYILRRSTEATGNNFQFFYGGAGMSETRPFAILNCKKGQIVSVTSDEGITINSNLRNLSTDGNVRKFVVLENGNIIFNAKNGSHLYSVEIEQGNFADFTYGYTSWSMPAENDMTITIPAHKAGKPFEVQLSNISGDVTCTANGTYTEGTKTLTITAPAAGANATTTLTVGVARYNIVVTTEAASGVVFNPATRYSEVFIDARKNDFYSNKNTGGLGFGTNLDYVPGLVAKGIIEAVDFYKDHKVGTINNDKLTTWYNAVKTFGEKPIADKGKNGQSFDDLNATKIYFGLKKVAASGAVTGIAADNTAWNTKLGQALSGIRTATSTYSISSSHATYPITVPEMQGGWWHKSDYINQMWGDGQYMGTALLAQLINDNDVAGTSATDWDLVAKQIKIYHNYAWDSSVNLPHHAFAADKGKGAGAALSHSDTWKFDGDTYHNEGIWGRAAGWYFMALVDVLEQMPTNHADYNTIKGYLNDLAAGLKAHQDAETGCWYQLPLYDNTFSVAEYNNGTGNGVSGRVYNYLESSATALFTAGYLKGMRLGLLDKSSYEETAKNAYQGFIEHFVNNRNNILWTCRSAGLGGSGDNYKADGTKFRDGSNAYYLKGNDVAPVRPSENITEGKSLGAFIMAAVEYERAYMTSYTVTYDAQSHGNVKASDTQANPGDAITLAGVTPHKEYTFLGWSTTQDATQPDDNMYAGSQYTPSSDITLYAVYRHDNTIGSEHTNWWQSFSDMPQLQPGRYKSYTFKNRGGNESHKNWVLVVTNNGTGHNGDGIQPDGSNELFVLRADGHSWGSIPDGVAKVYKAGTGTIGTEGYGEINASGNAEFVQAMKDADVTMQVSRISKRIYVYATYTCTIPATDDDAERTEKYVLTYKSGEINTDTYVSFTTENSVISFTGQNIGDAHEVKITDEVNGTGDVLSAEGISVKDMGLAEGTNVTYVATPAPGYNFIRWERGSDHGEVLGAAATYTTVVSASEASLIPRFDRPADCTHTIQVGTIGATDNSTAWWTVMSPFYELTPGFDRTFTFTSHTYNDVSGAHLKNWGLVGATQDAHSGDTNWSGKESYTMTGNGANWSNTQAINNLYLGDVKIVDDNGTVLNQEMYNTFKSDMTDRDAATTVTVSYGMNNIITTTVTTVVNNKTYTVNATSKEIAGGTPLYFFFSVNKNHLTNFTAIDPVSNIPTHTYYVKAVDASGNDIKVITSGEYTEGETVNVTYPQFVLDGTTLYSVKQNYYGNGDWFHYTFNPSDGKNYPDRTLKIPYTAGNVANVEYYSEAEDIPGFYGTTSNGNRASMGKAAYTIVDNGGDHRAVDLTTLPSGTYQLFIRGLNGNSTTRTAVFSIKNGSEIGRIDIPRSNDARGSFIFTLDAEKTITVDMPASSASGLDWIYIVAAPVLQVNVNETVVSLDKATVEAAHYTDVSVAGTVERESKDYYNTKYETSYVAVNETGAIAFEVRGFHNHSSEVRTLKIYDGNTLVGTIDVLPKGQLVSSGVIAIPNSGDIHTIKITGDGRDVYPYDIKFYTQKTSATLNPTAGSVRALETVVYDLNVPAGCSITSMVAPTSPVTDYVTAEYNTATKKLTLTGVKETTSPVTLSFNITGDNVIFSDATATFDVTVAMNTLTLGFKDSEGKDYTQYSVNADKEGLVGFVQPELRAFAKVGTIDNANVNTSDLNVSYGSDKRGVTVAGDGTITIDSDFSGTAIITATAYKANVFSSATANFLISVSRGLDWKMGVDKYSNNTSSAGAGAPAVREQFQLKKSNGDLLLTGTFGGWNRGQNNEHDNNSYYYPKADGTKKYQTDSWSELKTQTPAMDGYSVYRNGLYDASDESLYSSMDKLYNGKVYGAERFGWFKVPDVIDTKTVKYPFTLPVRGAYMTFEPEVNGMLTIYIDQNGAWNSEKDDVYTPDGDLYSVDADGNKLKFPSVVPWQFRPHAFFIVDQDGTPVEQYTNFTYTTQTPVTTGLKPLKDIQSAIDKEKDSKKKATLQKQKALLEKFLNEYDLEDGAKFKCIINPNEDGYTDVTNIGNWPEFRDYMSPREQQAVHDNWNNGINGAQSITKLDNGAYLAIDEGMVKYEFYAAAHQTYYIFSNFSKLGFAGCNFVEDKTDGNQPNADLYLGENTAYVKPIVITEGVQNTTLGNNTVKKVGQISIGQYKSITLDRAFTAGNWNTICLPYTVTEKEVREVFGDGTELLVLDNFRVDDAGVGIVHFTYHEIQDIIAGYPYFIKPTKNVAANTFTVYNKLIDPDMDLFIYEAGNGYKAKGVDGFCTANVSNGKGTTNYSCNLKEGDIFLSSNNLYISKGTSYLRGYRSYIAAPEEPKLRAKSLVFEYNYIWDEEEEPTRIDIEMMDPEMLETFGVQRVYKGVYNLSGQKVGESLDDLPKGIYILNGVKVVKQ